MIMSLNCLHLPQNKVCMKIAYCVPQIITSGGIERVLSNKIKYLLDQGYEVYMILREKSDEQPFFDFDNRIIYYRMDFDFTARGIKEKFFEREYKQRYLAKLTQILNEIKPDITISIFDKYSKYLYQINDGSKKIIERHFGKYKRSRQISRLENFSWGEIFTYWYRKADYDIVKHYDKFVVLTEEDKKLWGDLPNIVVIPNSVSFIPDQKSTNKEKRIIAVGRSSKQKQLDVLIKIWAKIAHKYPDWTLVTYGNGNLKPLKSLAKQLGVEEQVINNPPSLDVSCEMINSSIYTLTSKYEGMPLVLLEAMACGLPLVAFACKCGPRDIITDGEDGFLIEEGNWDLFAAKLSLLIENYDLRHKMGEIASHNVLRFTEDIVMNKWIALFDELVNS